MDFENQNEISEETKGESKIKSRIRTGTSNTLNKFGTLTRRSIYRIIRKNNTNKVVANYSYKKEYLKLGYNGDRLMIEINNKKNILKGWFWDAEIEFFLEYIRLIQNFCKQDKKVKKKNKKELCDNFVYKLKNDPDDVMISVSPELRRGKWKYNVCLETTISNSSKIINNIISKVGIRILESDLEIFLKNILKFEFEIE